MHLLFAFFFLSDRRFFFLIAVLVLHAQASPAETHPPLLLVSSLQDPATGPRMSRVREQELQRIGLSLGTRAGGPGDVTGERTLIQVRNQVLMLRTKPPP